jgi:hypothetical protein
MNIQKNSFFQMVSRYIGEKIYIFHYVLPLILFILITIVMVLIPTGFDITNRFIGGGEVVVWSNYFWWADFAITQLHVNPLYNPMLFSPLGMDIVDSSFPLILFVPITHFFGSVASYNLYLLFSFILTGFGMYLLAQYLLNDPYIAFIVGIIFAFFPFHFGSAFGHVHTFSIMWIPFFVLFLLKMYENPTYFHAIICGIFFSMNALTSWTIAVMLILFILIFLSINFQKVLEEKFFKCLIVFIITSFLLIIPGLFYILKGYFSNSKMLPDLYFITIYSADPLAFLLPSPLHPVLGPITASMYSQFTGNLSENIVFIGYSVIGLTALGLIARIKKSHFNLFIISGAVFLLLSLGPYLHFNGAWRFTSSNITVMLPGIILYYLPFFNMIRVPSRYDIMIMFSLAIIAGFGVQALVTKFRITGVKKLFFCSIILLMILFEYAAVLPTEEVKLIPIFYNNLSKEQQSSIIEVPIIRSDLDDYTGIASMSAYYQYQKVHTKNIFGGYFDRINPVYKNFALQDPVVSVLFSGKQDIISANIQNPLAYLKEEYDVHYIIFHPALMDTSSYNELIKYLGDQNTTDNSVPQDPLVIYSTADTGDQYSSSGNFVIKLKDGWLDKEYWSSEPTRWISQNASFLINSTRNQTITLYFNIRSFHNQRTLKVFLNDQLVSSLNIPTYFIQPNVTIPLSRGENFFQFSVEERCERPEEIPELHNPDPRCLGLAFQRITIKSNE